MRRAAYPSRAAYPRSAPECEGFNLTNPAYSKILPRRYSADPPPNASVARMFYVGPNRAS